jgi:hypothetical protein
MKGIIYKITGYDLTYFGSTIQPLNDRKYTHKSSYKNKDKRQEFYCTSWLILEKGDDWKMEQIEELDFEDLDELRLREAYYQKNNECVNKMKLKTNDELREYKKVWAEKDRRNKGCKIKAEMTLTQEEGYVAKKARERRAKESPEQKEIRLQKRRERYAKKEQTEEQKEKAKLRAKKQRENKVNNLI